MTTKQILLSLLVFFIIQNSLAQQLKPGLTKMVSVLFLLGQPTQIITKIFLNPEF
jgi:hypothetical protein